MQRRAFGVRRVADGDRGEKVGLAFDRRRSAARRQICHRCRTPKIVGERHDGAAVERAEAVVEFFSHGHLGDDLVRRNVRDLDTHELGERRLKFCVGIHRVP